MRTLLATIVCVAALAGCGSATEPEDEGTAAPASSPAEPQTAADAKPVLVRLHVSGGFAGVRRTHVVDTADPPPGLTPGQVADIVGLAGSAAVRDYAGDHVDRGECCDLMSYRLVILHADGSTVRIVTNDADHPPAAYSRLVDLVARAR